MLLDKLGVKAKPDHQDAIDVLLEIANSQFAQSNQRVIGHPEHEIVLAAWQLLSAALQQGAATKEEIRRKLSQEKCVITTGGLLQKPSLSFFEDRPRWAEKFKLIQNDIVPRTKDCWPAMEAAGVQRLSQAVKTYLIDLKLPQADTEIPKRLRERELLIRRIEGDHPLQLERIHEIEFQKAERIEVNRKLHAFNRDDEYHESVDAILLDGALYFKSVNGKTPFAGIARELSFALLNGDSYTSLALGLNHILSSPTFEDAKAILDELGYPPLQRHESVGVQGVTATTLGEERELSEQSDPNEDYSSFSYSQKPENDNEILGRTVASPSESISPKQDGRESSQVRRKPKRSATRLLSYVEPFNNEDEMTEKNEDSSSRLKAIGQRGVDIVMAFERDHGRQPEDANINNPNNPGYDIKSFDPETGQTRYIEVKASVGVWDGRNPARMTDTEFEMAHERGDNAWLYVVEQVESDEPQIYCIQAPTRQVKIYCFDHEWQKISESFDASSYVNSLLIS